MKCILLLADTSHSINKREDTESHLLVVEFDIILSVTLSEGETLISKIDYYDDIMANVLLAIVQDMLNNGTLDIQNFTTKSDSLQAPAYADLECDSGYFLDSDSCRKFFFHENALKRMKFFGSIKIY